MNGTTKTHPTTATKGDVSYLQCKAVGRNLQDLKRIAAQEFLSDVYLDVAARTPCHAARVLCHASKSSEYAKSRPFYATSGFLIYAVFTPFQASDC